jgi:radical SAM family uncharacterized protein/radical SAM-linked protein
VVRPGQYLGNEWGARRKPFESADVRLCLAFPDMYELGMSNFGLKILYQIVNRHEPFLCDRTYAPGTDMEQLLRERNIPLWGWEGRRALPEYELIGFSLQYELTYTNVLNMLDLAQLPVFARERTSLFPLVFGGGPSAVNPEPMAPFMDFFMIGDGEEAVPAVLEIVRQFKAEHGATSTDPILRQKLLARLATEVPGIYVPALYELQDGNPVPQPTDITHLVSDPSRTLPERVLRQVVPLSDNNQPTNNLVPYLSLVHDREVLEVRRGCDRGCRFCQPGYTFLPVRERSADDLVRLSKEALGASGHQEYSLLSLCVSDYTSLHDSVRALNEEHSARRSSMSFPSQRADRMNLDIAEELKAVRKSGITLAPEAGTERMRAVINKGLSHQQIISAIEAAYQSGWASIKLYFMCCLPTERDEDLLGVVEILKEASTHCRAIRKTDPLKYRKDIDFTCTISNFVPKPFTPFQWFGPVDPKETARKHRVLKEALKEARLRNVQLNVTEPQISLLESVISRGDRRVGQIIYDAWRAGCTFDAWDDRFQPGKWHEVAEKHGTTLVELGCTARDVGSPQPWDVVHIGLNTWWMVKEWEKAMTELETAPCTENLCHACGVCTELETKHALAQAKPEVMKRNPFVKELSANTKAEDHHPSLFFMKPAAEPVEAAVTRIRFILKKDGDLRFIGHLDLQHLLTRAARRAFIAIAYSNGFNPQPKLNLAAPLPLFQQSEGEVGEIELAQAIDAEEFRLRINRQLPDQVQLTAARTLADKTVNSLASVLSSARYSATLVRLDRLDHEDGASPCAQPDEEIESVHARIEQRVEHVLLQESLLVAPAASESEAAKHSKAASPRDVRPGIYSLQVTSRTPLTLEFRIAHGSQMHVKPSDVLGFLQPPDLVPQLIWRVTRLELAAADQTPLFHI